MEKILKIQEEMDQLYKVQNAMSLAITLGEVNNKSEEVNSKVQQAYKKAITLLEIKREELVQAVLDYGDNI